MSKLDWIMAGIFTTLVAWLLLMAWAVWQVAL